MLKKDYFRFQTEYEYMCAIKSKDALLLTNTHDLFIYEFDTTANILSIYGYTRNAVRSDGCTRFRLIFYKENEIEMMRVRYVSGRSCIAIGEEDLNKFFAQKMKEIADTKRRPQYRFDG